MSLGGHSLDQLARVRRLLQLFAAPDPRVHLILDAEAHAAAVEPELAVLHATPFGGLGNVEDGDAHGADGPPREHRHARSSAGPGEAARRQRRQDMLAPSKVQPTPSKLTVSGASRATPSHETLRPSEKPSTGLRELNATAQNKVHPAESSKDKPVVRNKQTNVSKLPAPTRDNSDKSVFTIPVGTNKQKKARVEPSEKQVELGTLVQRVMRRQRPARKQSTGNDVLAPSALPKHARLHDATIIQQRPLPRSLVLPVSPVSASTESLNTEAAQTARSHTSDLAVTPNGANKQSPLDPARTRPAAQPTFFFNAIEAREADESEDSLTDRIDQVLREQARRQGVDLT